MATNQTVIADCLVEYNLQGAPTGNVWINGKKILLTTFTALEPFVPPSGQVIDFGRTTYLIRRNILVANPEPTTVGQTAQVQDVKEDFQTVTF